MMKIYTTKFIEKLSKGQVAHISEDITFEEFVGALTKWNKRTSTSPSGIHLGHYKLLIKFNMFKTYYNSVICAIKSGAPLGPLAGNHHMYKLCVIHIFEADYNLMLKVMWSRKAIWKLHNLILLNEGQAGSRPGNRAIDVAIQK
jgi:hypothetical protein